jgi:hypothetical protein
LNENTTKREKVKGHYRTVTRAPDGTIVSSKKWNPKTSRGEPPGEPPAASPVTPGPEPKGSGEEESNMHRLAETIDPSGIPGSEASAGSQARFNPNDVTEEMIMEWANRDPMNTYMLALYREQAEIVKAQTEALKRVNQYINVKPAATAPSILEQLKDYIAPEDAKKLFSQATNQLFSGEGSQGGYQQKLIKRLAEKMEDYENHRIEENTDKLMLALYGENMELVARERAQDE